MDKAGTPHTPHGEWPDRAFMSSDRELVEAFGNGFGCFGLQRKHCMLGIIFNCYLNYHMKNIFSHYNLTIYSYLGLPAWWQLYIVLEDSVDSRSLELFLTFHFFVKKWIKLNYIWCHVGLVVQTIIVKSKSRTRCDRFKPEHEGVKANSRLRQNDKNNFLIVFKGQAFTSTT